MSTYFITPAREGCANLWPFADSCQFRRLGYTGRMGLPAPAERARLNLLGADDGAGE